ncbi:hypothetical protein MMH89_03405 [Candidatus Comchoanobacter bicostacola]|uniref:Uncharacterized protein n=1 Tax=Candidatus Comchoanobacter bicostacola TaxID=2919598 RepID=A0ABY5DHY7_9GAMM|nr:hypothetical protein [Candidatus Comchoanobacter bicostacola]UTC24270.1 hypothetical protein MMH89_03405 [Candidatus Comchoanobacter bicostacola]
MLTNYEKELKKRNYKVGFRAMDSTELMQFINTLKDNQVLTIHTINHAMLVFTMRLGERKLYSLYDPNLDMIIHDRSPSRSEIICKRIEKYHKYYNFIAEKMAGQNSYYVEILEHNSDILSNGSDYCITKQKQIVSMLTALYNFDLPSEKPKIEKNGYCYALCITLRDLILNSPSVHEALTEFQTNLQCIKSLTDQLQPKMTQSDSGRKFCKKDIEPDLLEKMNQLNTLMHGKSRNTFTHLPKFTHIPYYPESKCFRSIISKSKLISKMMCEAGVAQLTNPEVLKEISEHIKSKELVLFKQLRCFRYLLPEEHRQIFLDDVAYHHNIFNYSISLPVSDQTLKDQVLKSIESGIELKDLLDLNTISSAGKITPEFIAQVLRDDRAHLILLENINQFNRELQSIVVHHKLPELFSDAVSIKIFTSAIGKLDRSISKDELASIYRIASKASEDLLLKKMEQLMYCHTSALRRQFLKDLGEIKSDTRAFNFIQLATLLGGRITEPMLEIMTANKIWASEIVHSPDHFYRLKLTKQRELFLNPRFTTTLLSQRAYASQLFGIMKGWNPTELNELFDELDASELVSLLTNRSYQDERILDLEHAYSNRVIHDQYAPITAIKRMTNTHSQEKLALNFLKLGTETDKVAKLAELAPSQYKNFVLHHIKSELQDKTSPLSDEVKGFIEHELSKNSDISQKTIRALIRYQAADSCELLGTVSNPELLATIATTITPAYQLNLDLCPNILAYLREQVVSHWDRYTYNPKIDFFKSASYQSSLLRRLNDFSIREKVLSGIEHPGLQTYHAYTSADKIQLNDEIVNAVLNTYPDSISISAIQQYCSSSTCLTLQQTLCAVIRGSESPYKALEQHPVIKLSLQRILESSSPGMSYEDIVAKNHTELFIKLLNIKEVQDNLSGCYQYDQHAHLKHLRDALCDCIKQAAKDKALYRTGLNASLFAQVLSLGHSYKEIMKSYTLSVLARVLLVSTDKKVKTTIKTHCSGWTYFMSRVYAFFLRLFRPKYCSKLCKQQISATTLNSRLIATIAKHDDISSKLASEKGPLLTPG